MAQYAEIVDIIISPASPQPGGTVWVGVKIKNKYTGSVTIKCVAKVNSATFMNLASTVPPGSIMSYNSSFAMPSGAVTIYAYSYWHGSDLQYHLDDEKQKVVTSDGGPPPTPAATIVTKTMSYDGVTIPLPAQNVSQGSSVQLKVVVRNNTTETKRLGIGIIVADPTTAAAYTYAVFEDVLWGTRPGETHEFVARPDFVLSKVGVYGIWIGAYVYPEGAAAVDTFQGILCTAVSQEVPTGFSVSRPTASPYSAPPGNVLLGCPVGISNAPTVVSFQVKCIVYEGSVLPGAGTKLWEQTKAVSLANGAHMVHFTHPSVVGTIDRRDVGVEVYYNGVKRAGGEWDDVFYVTQAQPAQTLRVDITPVGAGQVTTSPASIEGKTTWMNNEAGTFAYGTDVEVTAVPAANYQFEKWSDEIVGGVSYSNPAYVQSMTEHRAVKCHFREVTAPDEPGPNFQLIQDYVYPFASTYAGKAETQPFTFSLLAEQVPFQDWFRDRIVNAFEQKVSEEGSHMLGLKIWEDTTPALRTDYRVEATCTASPVPWVPIIVAVLAILFIVAITFALGKLKEFWYGPGDGGGGVGFGDTIVMMMVMVMMVIMMEQTREFYEPAGTPPRPKPVTEATVKAAKWTVEKGVPAAIKAGAEAVKLAEGGLREAKRLTAKAREEWRKASEERRAEKEEELRRAEEREEEKKRKLSEAKADLMRRREERAREGERQT